jgi:hypothetical protein
VIGYGNCAITRISALRLQINEAFKAPRRPPSRKLVRKANWVAGWENRCPTGATRAARGLRFSEHDPGLQGFTCEDIKSMLAPQLPPFNPEQLRSWWDFFETQQRFAVGSQNISYTISGVLSPRTLPFRETMISN